MYSSLSNTRQQRQRQIKKIRQFANPKQQVFQSSFGERAWLKNRGKQKYISFTNQKLAKLRNFFNSLCSKGDQSITADDLYDPFIAFGLSQNPVDLDGSGQIQFDEFLQIISKIKRGQSKDSKNSAMFDFFQSNIMINIALLGQQLVQRNQQQDITKKSKILQNNKSKQIKTYYKSVDNKVNKLDKFDKQQDKDLPFRLQVSKYRRRKILDSMMGKTKQQRQKGGKILKSFKKQVQSTPGLKDTLNNSSQKNSLLMNGIDYKPKRSIF